MQIRYLGDARDYILYALLRHLARQLGWRIGMNWYRTDPAEVDAKNNKDGNQRGYLCDADKQCLDPELFALMQKLQTPQRSLDVVARRGVLPRGTLYFDGQYRKDGADGFARGAHHRQSLAALQAAELFFLNPDNGLQVKSVPTKGHKKAPKYIFYDELDDYLAMGKPLISVQFQGRMSVAERLARHRGGLTKRPVIIQCAGNMLFFCFAPDGASGRAIKTALQAFATHAAQNYSGTWQVFEP